jgi:hypothetical protein
VLLAAVTAALKVVTPTAVPTVVPTKLKHQNAAIAAAAMARAKNLRLFAMLLTLPFFPRIAFSNKLHSKFWDEFRANWDTQ